MKLERPPVSDLSFFDFSNVRVLIALNMRIYEHLGSGVFFIA
jgi:hypothetical protein